MPKLAQLAEIFLQQGAYPTNAIAAECVQVLARLAQDAAQRAIADATDPHAHQNLWNVRRADATAAQET